MRPNQPAVRLSCHLLDLIPTGISNSFPLGVAHLLCMAHTNGPASHDLAGRPPFVRLYRRRGGGGVVVEGCEDGAVRGASPVFRRFPVTNWWRAERQLLFGVTGTAKVALEVHLPRVRLL